MKHFGKLAVLSLAVLGAACGGGGGGGGGGGSTSVFSPISAQFIDAPVNGITVIYSGGATSSTATRGNFSCVRGETLTFKLKNLTIGTGTCTDKVFVQEVAGANAAKAAQLILTLSGIAEADVPGIAANGVLTITSDDVVFGGITDVANVPASGASITVGGQTVPVIAASAAQVHVNRFIALNASISDQLAAILEEAAISSTVVLVGTLTSGTSCYPNLKIGASVSKVTTASTPYYTFFPRTIAYYETGVTPLESGVTITCPPGTGGTPEQDYEDETCFDEDISEVGQKIVSSDTLRISVYESTDFAAGAAAQNPDFGNAWVQFTAALSEKTSVNFVLTHSNGNISGSLNEAGTYLSESTGVGTQESPLVFSATESYSCSYSIVAQ